MRSKFLSLLFLIPLFATAQIDVNWGLPQKQIRKTELTTMLGEDSTGIYALRADLALFGSREPILERYKKSDMGLDYSKHISMRLPSNVELESQSVFYLAGKFVVFGSTYDKIKNLNELYYCMLDDRGFVTKEWTVVATIAAEKESNSGSFFATLSNDYRHILLIINPPFEKASNEKYTLQLLDSDMNTSWTKDISPPYQDQFFSLDNYIVSTQGDVYMLATVSKDRSVMTRAQRRATPTYYHTVLIYDRSTDELVEYKVDLDPKFISDVKMTVNDSGDIICAGFYSNKSSNDVIGSFFMKIDKKTKEVVKQGTMDFSQDFLAEFMSPRKVKSGKELANYDLKYLVLRDDGGAVLVAEQYYEILVQNYDPASKMYTYTYYYYYNEIIVVSINADGQIAWEKKIPKYQVSRNDLGYYSSFSFAVSGDKMYFMFNDSPKNMDLKNGDKYKYMTNPKKSVAVLVTMDSYGNQQRQAMFSNDDLKIILRPKLFMQSSDTQLYLYGEKGSTFKLASVKIS
ncbi:MAG TPA: hypothetical protein VL651_16975 [Bacteroidia bacterium]|jgi:hypothetical protein|nr:hypothetical protein [Bacteroidia bacterium]